MICLLPLSMTTGYYLCPCLDLEVENSRSGNVLCQNRTNGSRCESVRTALEIELTTYDFQLIPSFVNFFWKGEYDENAADNLTLYLETTTNGGGKKLWVPIEGCIDVPLTQKQCRPKRCYHEGVIITLFRKGQNRYKYPPSSLPPCQQICNSLQAEQSEGYELSLNDLYLEEKDRNINIECFFRFNENLEEYQAKKTVSLYGREMYKMPLEYFELHEDDQNISFLIDKKKCQAQQCQYFNITLHSIHDYNFPENGTSYVCLYWNITNSEKLSLLCMEPAAVNTDTMERPTYPKPQEYTVIAILAIVFSVVLIAGIVSNYLVWNTFKFNKEKEGRKNFNSAYDNLEVILQKRFVFIPPPETDSQPDVPSLLTSNYTAKIPFYNSALGSLEKATDVVNSRTFVQSMTAPVCIPLSDKNENHSQESSLTQETLENCALLPDSEIYIGFNPHQDDACSIYDEQRNGKPHSRLATENHIHAGYLNKSNTSLTSCQECESFSSENENDDSSYDDDSVMDTLY
ncbi:unnamed protein product [Clavelina lepadiformis]|uniref:Uncharacterized protein n=1 Tax=Clavelina lepadiformis TaxID=159417 RepID=A0ABP0FZI9_CLALP